MQSDVTRVRQILLDLLSNAATFTEKGSVSLCVTREQLATGDWVRFQVADTGIGMTSEQVSYSSRLHR
jgi:signal transduction histidine kinase